MSDNIFSGNAYIQLKYIFSNLTIRSVVRLKPSAFALNAINPRAMHYGATRVLLTDDAQHIFIFVRDALRTRTQYTSSS